MRVALAILQALPIGVGESVVLFFWQLDISIAGKAATNIMEVNFGVFIG